MNVSRARRDHIRTRSFESAVAGNGRGMPRGFARRTSPEREWREWRASHPPPSEDDILDDCDIALDIILRNVTGVKDLAEKIDRRLRMQKRREILTG